MPFSDPNEVDPDQAPPAPGRILPFQKRDTPDWLASPADDLAAAPPEQGPARVLPLPAPVLKRPDAGSVPPKRVEAAPQAAAAPPAGPAKAWAAAASSVPVIRAPLPARHDEPEEEPPPAWSDHDLPDAAKDVAAPVAPGRPKPALEPLAEPWWVVALDALRSDRRLQAGMAAGVLAAVLLGLWLWPRGVGSVSIAAVHRHPKQFDGRVIDVRGRVGHDVFQVAGGYTFFLLQGRDTIVTFARTTQPRPGEVVTVKGQVSTGFLDGVPRQALFEADSSPK